MNYVSLPLYQEQDYRYRTVLNNIACVFRLYYNQRVDGWFFDLKEEGSANYFVEGERLVPLYPMILDYTHLPLGGFLWLEPIGSSEDKFRTDSYNLHKWFRLFFITNP